MPGQREQGGQGDAGENQEKQSPEEKDIEQLIDKMKDASNEGEKPSSSEDKEVSKLKTILEKTEKDQEKEMEASEDRGADTPKETGKEAKTSSQEDAGSGPDDPQAMLEEILNAEPVKKLEALIKEIKAKRESGESTG